MTGDCSVTAVAVVLAALFTVLDVAALTGCTVGASAVAAIGAAAALLMQQHHCSIVVVAARHMSVSSLQLNPILKQTDLLRAFASFLHICAHSAQSVRVAAARGYMC
jgi:hypothetical protein